MQPRRFVDQSRHVQLNVVFTAHAAEKLRETYNMNHLHFNNMNFQPRRPLAADGLWVKQKADKIGTTPGMTPLWCPITELILVCEYSRSTSRSGNPGEEWYKVVTAIRRDVEFDPKYDHDVEKFTREHEIPNRRERIILNKMHYGEPIEEIQHSGSEIRKPKDREQGPPDHRAKKARLARKKRMRQQRYNASKKKYY